MAKNVLQRNDHFAKKVFVFLFSDHIQVAKDVSS